MTDPQKRATLMRLVAAGALPLLGASSVTLAQTQPKGVRLGLIAFGARELSEHWERALIDGLRQRGYVEGRNLVFERRYAEGHPERMATISAELAALKLDAVVTTCTPSTRIMQKATSSTPLVMAAVSDPVGQGLIASYRRPGGNVTGLASQFEDIAGKMLELLREAVPGASPVAVMLNPTNPVHEILLKQMEEPARILKLRLVPVGIALNENFSTTFNALAKQGIASVLVLPDDPRLTHLRRSFVEMAARHRLPTFFGLREAVEEGGLMSYGESMINSYARAAEYVDKVVKGAIPAELPVELPTRFELAVNLKTARALGLTIPPTVMVRATRVIE